MVESKANGAQSQGLRFQRLLGPRGRSSGQVVREQAEQARKSLGRSSADEVQRGAEGVAEATRAQRRAAGGECRPQAVSFGLAESFLAISGARGTDATAWAARVTQLRALKSFEI